MLMLFKIAKILCNIQYYFLLFLLYSLIRNLKEVILSEIGSFVFFMMFNFLMPISILAPFLFYTIVGKTRFKLYHLYVIVSLCVTIVVYEFVFKV